MTDLFGTLQDDAEPPRRARDRSREGAGKSRNSHIKHDLIARAVDGQIAAYRANHSGRILLIDGNAGDGIGVEKHQLDMFDTNLSRSTPETLIRAASFRGEADVLLCESDRQRRESLATRFPLATIIGDHAGALDHLRADHRYAIWVSDPCGPSEHGVEYMRALAERVPLADFVVAFNEGWVVDHLGSENARRQENLRVCRERYLPMVPPQWWLEQLGRRHLARTNTIIKIGPRFKCRILVISNYLTDAVKRRPFEVIR